ncbi:DUF4124 domain-containing protein [Massilia sp. CFBP9012]|uniref:DUF4124 domain-containing protein n=1 Tax=Massilia sp. CFBP9012 TaxID=3096531 RepID=UPI002A6B5882|nr:DUF4124 domain-containing protein [Massilia sp. CFBP9012]MDY0977459.1 DUF4124 domain-containing protein [Massilia sp. CFBP9012]
MKRQLSICLLAAAAIAAPSAYSDTVIVKCIDGAGRVTFTDRPCEAGAATVRMASMPSSEGVTKIAPYPLAAREDVLPPARALQRSAAPMPRVKATPLASDVATLKAARAQFLIGDVGSRETLAGLE